MPDTRTRPIKSFALTPGRKVGPRYVVEAPLGNGTEGEVYQIREVDTGIVRAAKLYYPHRDRKKKLSIRHARKLNGLRDCPIVLQYHHSEIIMIRREKVVAMISDLCEGQQLEKWIASHPGKRLRPYLALQVFYNLVRGLENIHAMGQYHADVHSQNILVQPRGVRFEIKLIDFYEWGPPRPGSRSRTSSTPSRCSTNASAVGRTTRSCRLRSGISARGSSTPSCSSDFRP